MKELREKEIATALEAKKSLVILGKKGIGKSYLINKIRDSIKNNIIFYNEPPTSKTILTDLAKIIGIESSKKTKDELIEIIKKKDENPIVVCIDEIEKSTPSLITVLDNLMNTKHVKIIMAGHLGGKKKHNSTWLKAKAIFLKELGIQDSMKLIDTLWANGNTEQKKVIANAAQGIPEKIIALCEDAKNGIIQEEKEKIVDFTPILLIIGTIGLIIRVIGYGYASMEQYIIGGTIAAIFWGAFWIFRGYTTGWFGGGTKDRKSD